MSFVPLVIYHGKCNDGLTGAWAIKKAMPQSDLFEGHYGQPPPDVTDRVVILVDFSYKRPVLLDMLDKCKSLTILDHHRTAEADLKGLSHPNLASVVFDMERSGAGIAWDTFHPGEKRPWIVDYVEHNDLWRHSNPKYDGVMPDCKEYIEAIRSYPMDIETVEFLSNPNPGLMVSLRNAGVAILRHKAIMVEQAASLAHRVNFRDAASGTTISTYATNVPFFLSSETAHELADKNQKNGGVPLGITYYFSGLDNKWHLSLRSIGEYDVSLLAANWGGGGHRNAAGAECSVLPWLQNSLSAFPE